MEFLRKELTEVERAGLPSLSLADPVSRELIKDVYFRRYPEERQRLQKADQRKQQKDNDAN